MFKDLRISYANVVSTLALFIVVSGGTAVAAGVAPNSVKSSSVADNALVSADLKDGRGVTGADVRDDSLTGADIDEGSLKLPTTSGAAPTGPAGGSLTGSFPNPTLALNSVGTDQLADKAVTAPKIGDAAVGADEIAPDAVDAGRVKDGALTGADVADDGLTGRDVAADSIAGADVDESSLGAVPSALLGGIGRTSPKAGGSCDPESAERVTCNAVELKLPAPARVLLMAKVTGANDGGSGPLTNGECSFGTSVGRVRGTDTPVSKGQTVTMFAVSRPVGGGTVSFGVDCNEGNQVKFENVTITAVALSAA
jgi:hypothetical protein